MLDKGDFEEKKKIFYKSHGVYACVRALIETGELYNEHPEFAEFLE